MNLKKILVVAIAAIAVENQNVIAQDIHFSQFTASPLTINPAFTGMFDGMYRVNGIYRNQWASVTTPYVTEGISFDKPIFRKFGQDDYLAVGAELFTDKSGDGNLMNTTGMLSVAYHKFLGADAKSSISVGMQGGFVQKSIDYSLLYFNDEFRNGGYQPGTTSELLKNKISTYTTSVGLNFSHSFSEKFGIQIGTAAYNLNQAKESFMKKPNNQVGLGMRLNGQLGAVWNAGERLSIRPAVLYQTQSNASEIIAGSEFHMIVGDAEIKSVAPAVFLGAYTRMADCLIFTAGLEYKGFRAGVSYDKTNSKLQQAASGVSGFEVGISYVKPNPLDFARRVFFPCARF